MTSSGIRAVDPGQLRALLRAYFRMSVRETVLMRRRSGPSSITYVLVMYAVFGLIVGLAAFAHPDVLLFAVGLHAMTFFAVGMSAIIEANEVLFDRREEEILFPLPVHASTLLLAKMGTLVGFTFLIALALNLFPSFFGLAAADAHWWFPLVHLASVLLLTVLACAGVVCVYGLVLRIFGRERFENIAVWAQVGMIVMVVGGFQILPRMMESSTPESLQNIAKWLLPTPPGWFAAFDAWLAGGASGTQVIVFALVAVGATALLAWIAVIRLAAGYLETTRVSGIQAKPREGKAIAARPWRSRNPLLRWWLCDPIEWGAFRLATAYLRRDREIKLRVYTSLSMFVVLVVLSILDARRGRATFLPLLLLAFSGTAVLTAIEALESSSQYAAADIFASTPIESAAPLYHGVRKACMLFVQAPLLLASLTLIALLPSGESVSLATLAAPLVVLLPTISLIPGSIGVYVPLSKPPRRGEQTSRRVQMLVGTMIGSTVVLGIGYVASMVGLLWVLLLLEIVAVGFVHAWLLRVIRARPLLTMTAG